jgi:drug/metabolite transporter (DMT)-like permease
LALAAAALAVSTGAPLARWAAPTPALAISALRTAFAGVVLCLAGARQLHQLARLGARDRLRVVAAGLLLALHFGTWIASLSLTSTAASVALVSTSPAFAALLAGVNRDVVTRREWIGIAIAALGCAVVAGGDWRAGELAGSLTGGRALLGDALALAGAVSGAAYLVIGRQLRAAVPMTPYLGVVNLVASAALLGACALTATPIAPASGHAWLAVALAGCFTSAGGHTLLNAVVRILPTHLVALAALGETIGSSLIAWAAFGEVPPWHGALGGVIVIAGIGLGFVRKARP